METIPDQLVALILQPLFFQDAVALSITSKEMHRSATTQMVWSWYCQQYSVPKLIRTITINFISHGHLIQLIEKKIPEKPPSYDHFKAWVESMDFGSLLGLRVCPWKKREILAKSKFPVPSIILKFCSLRGLNTLIQHIPILYPLRARAITVSGGNVCLHRMMVYWPVVVRSWDDARYILNPRTEFSRFGEAVRDMLLENGPPPDMYNKLSIKEGTRQRQEANIAQAVAAACKGDSGSIARLEMQGGLIRALADRGGCFTVEVKRCVDVGLLALFDGKREVIARDAVNSFEKSQLLYSEWQQLWRDSLEGCLLLVRAFLTERISNGTTRLVIVSYDIMLPKRPSE